MWGPVEEQVCVTTEPSFYPCSFFLNPFLICGWLYLRMLKLWIEKANCTYSEQIVVCFKLKFNQSSCSFSF